MEFAGVLLAVQVMEELDKYGPYEALDRGMTMGVLTGLIGGIGATILETSQFSYDPPKTTPESARRFPWTFNVLSLEGRH